MTKSVRRAVMIEAAVTATMMIAPPMSVLRPGAPPRARNTHSGLKTGSITAIGTYIPLF